MITPFPVGTRIRFMQDITDRSIFDNALALQNQHGTITGHVCVGGYWVLVDGHRMPFRAAESEFEVIV